MPGCWWCSHDPKRAAENLRQVWEHTLREGVDEPGVFPVAPKLIDALVDLGELDQADAVTARLRALPEGQLLSLGRAQRRVKESGATRSSLDMATTAFEQLGSGGCAEQARLELDRGDARRPSPIRERTATDRRVADLAATGSSDKQVAREVTERAHGRGSPLPRLRKARRALTRTTGRPAFHHH